ncbi:MAG: LytTR family DNA-binding domain-containing protein [Xanthomonadales bacterium]|nr:LytTR family DNA-binding domain-containing protein [Xanthomonadales bacterium]
MVKLKTIVVDDESLARKLMLSYLEEFPEIEVLAECSNGREAVTAVLELEPDLMFLDIRMPGFNGFEVIKKIQPEILPMVIFCSAYERYALDAFEVHAVDYIVKPLDEQRLHLAVMRAVSRYNEDLHSGGNKGFLLGAIDAITSNVEERTAVNQTIRNVSLSADPERKIIIKDRDSIKLIKTDSIAWVDAAGDYMCVHADGETHIMRCTMKQLLKELDADVFKRVHRSTIVNLKCIEEVIPHTKGEYFLQIDNGERIKVSRKYRGTIKSFLNSLNKP